MARIECPHEADVLTMIATGRWPDRAPADLIAHVATCDMCADLAVVTSAIEDDRESGVPVGLPSAGTVWWRAQLRARQEAVKDVGRPITVAQAALLAAAGGIAGAVFGATSDWFQQGIRRAWAVVSNSAAAVHLPTPPLSPLDSSAANIANHSTGFLAVGIAVAAALAIIVWALREE
jgi:hypothetical protein